MSFIEYPTKQVPVLSQSDVVVVGGGPAGLAAAVSCARQGCKTILIDEGGVLGGTVSKVIMPSFGSLNYSIIKGIFYEVGEKLKATGSIIQKQGGSSPLDPEAYKQAVFDLVEREPIELLLHTAVVDVARQEGNLKALFVSTKSGMQAIQGQLIIDATGDGDVAAFAGESFAQGGDRQPMSLMFILGNADVRRFAEYVSNYPDKNEFTNLGNPLTLDVDKIDEDHPQVNAWGFFNHVKQGRASGELYLPHDNFAVIFLPARGTVFVNATNVSNLDPLSPRDLTSAEVESRKQMASVHNFLKKHVPGFENTFISASGSTVGVRESRRLEGQYVLNKTDVLNGASFPDAVALNGGRISIHEANEKQTWIPLKKPYQIPYRCLLGKANENLLVAGRCISADHIAEGSIRNVSCCFATGQAAGTAAALSIKNQVKPKDLNVKLLQQALILQGAIISPQRGAPQ